MLMHVFPQPSSSHDIGGTPQAIFATLSIWKGECERGKLNWELAVLWNGIQREVHSFLLRTHLVSIHAWTFLTFVVS